MSFDRKDRDDRGDRGDKGGKFDRGTRGGEARPKIRVGKVSASGKLFIDYKETESLRRLTGSNGKISGRKRTGADALEQRMIASAVKRARYMALVPYQSSAT